MGRFGFHLVVSVVVGLLQKNLFAVFWKERTTAVVVGYRAKLLTGAGERAGATRGAGGFLQHHLRIRGTLYCSRRAIVTAPHVAALARSVRVLSSVAVASAARSFLWRRAGGSAPPDQIERTSEVVCAVLHGMNDLTPSWLPRPRDGDRSWCGDHPLDRICASLGFSLIFLRCYTPHP
jgi:hypothetical protein